MKGLTIIIALLLSLCSYAQLTIGIKCGLNVSKFNGDEFYISENANKKGLVIGVIIEPKLSKHLSLKFEINYDQKGTYASETYPFSNVGYAKVGARLLYISLPLLLKVNFGEKGIFYFNTGMSYGILSKADYQVTQNGEFLINSDMKNNFNSTELSYVVGVGIKIPLTSKLGILVDPRYSIGLSNIAKTNPYFRATSLKNNTYTIALGLVVQLGKNKEFKQN
jgi:hypothetical protein